MGRDEWDDGNNEADESDTPIRSLFIYLFIYLIIYLRVTGFSRPESWVGILKLQMECSTEISDVEIRAI